MFAPDRRDPPSPRSDSGPGPTIPAKGADFEFAGSSEPATRRAQRASAEVFGPAFTAQIDTVAKAGLLESDPADFASNTLVIVTAPGNPEKVVAFADLAGVICRRPVPCGSAKTAGDPPRGAPPAPARRGVGGGAGIRAFTGGVRRDADVRRFAAGAARTLPLEICLQRAADANAAVALSILSVAVPALAVLGLGARGLTANDGR